MKTYGKHFKALALPMLLSLGLCACSSFCEQPSEDKVNDVLKMQEFSAGQVWIVPVGDMNKELLIPLAAQLSEETGLVIKVSEKMPVPMPKNKQANFDIRRKVFYKGLVDFADVIPLRTTSSVFIAVADSKDVHSMGYFADFDGIHALVNYAKLKENADAKLTNERLCKLLKRGIGVVYYHCDYSDDPNNIMYSALESLEDLDKAECKLSTESE